MCRLNKKIDSSSLKDLGQRRCNQLIDLLTMTGTCYIASRLMYAALSMVKKYCLLIRGLCLPDGCRLYTAPCGIGTKTQSGRHTPLYAMLCTAVFNHLGLNIYFNQLLIFGNQTRNHCYLPHEVISFQLHCMPFPYYYALSLNIIHMTQFLKISKRLTFDVICLDFVKIR